MKDSGIEWIGEIPEDWEVGPVKYFYTIQTGFTPLTQNEKYYDENGAVWVTIADITQCNKYIVDSKSKISNFYLEQYSPKETPVGSLLYSFKLSIGVTAFAGVPLYTNEAIASFINTEFVNLEFLYYSSFLIIYNANTNIYGAKLLNQELIKNAPIVFPPIAEQQRIADYLDKKCAAVDRLMENQRLQIEKLKEYKQSLITEAVTKGLDKTVPLKSSGVEWIGDIPEKWNITRIKYVCLFNPSTNSHIEKDEMVGYVPMECVKNGYMENREISIKEISSGLTCFANGDIIMAKVTPCFENGNIAIVSNLTNGIGFGSSELFVFRPTKIYSRFLFYFLRNNLFMEYAKATMTGTGGLKRVSPNFIRSLRFACPCEEEQQQIAEYLDKKCAEIDELISIKQQKIEKLTEYKKSLIYEYVTGKKQVG